jgi:hypothetical protein
MVCCWHCFSGFKKTPPLMPQLDRFPMMPHLSLVEEPRVEHQFLLLCDGYEERRMHFVRVSEEHTAIKHKCKVVLLDALNVGKKPQGQWYWDRNDGTLWVEWHYRGTEGAPRWHGYVKLANYVGTVAIPDVHLLRDVVTKTTWGFGSQTHASQTHALCRTC